MPKRKRNQETDSKGKRKGNFAKIPFQKMPLDSMIGSKSKKAAMKSKGVFTAKRGQ